MKLRSILLPSLAILGAAALTFCATTAQAQFNPVPLTAGSYTVDIVVPSNTLAAVPYCVNVFAGSGTCLSCDTTYYEMGMNNPYPFPGWNSGIPRHGTVFTNINNPNMTFLMPPDYTTNNELMIVNSGQYGVITAGTFNFVTPTTATKLAILDTGGNGGASVSYAVTHADNSTDTGTINVQDWFNGGASAAWGANGRMDQNGGFDNFNSSANNNNAPYLYASLITVSSNSPIVSVTFNYASGGGVDNFYAVSGANGGTTYTPIPVTGFNVIGTIPALQTLPVNATMDNGTNLVPYNGGLGNTWFEQGYDPTNATYGLPPSGSTFASFSQPNHFYQMGNYHSNNAILIDTNHQSASISPATFSAYTGLAFLTAGGHIGTGNKMTNVCVIQHADGVSETNTFFGYDWFESSVPNAIAYEANGRVDLNNRTLNNLGNQGLPFMFETYFALSDISSPVTNIMVHYKTAPAANATTYIMAISGTTSPIAPVITQEPQPTNQTWYPSQSAAISVLVAGTQPVTNTWLVESNGVFVPLQDGLDANGSTISGSTTTTLTISNLEAADGTNYEYIAANSAGSVTSSIASITINSGTPSAPFIDTQSPSSPFSVLTNHPDTTAFSVTVDPSSAPPITYQWYSVMNSVTNPIPGATAATYVNVDTNNESIFCIVSNFVGTATSMPVTITIFEPATPSQYESAVMAGHPVGYWPLNETNGTIAFDYASTNDGTYNGNYTLGVPGLNDPGLGQETSVAFDGFTAYVAIPGNGSLNITGPITVVQFVQPLAGGDTGFTTSLGHSDQSYRLDVANGQPHWADQGPDITDPNMINDGNWHQLVGVYDGTNQYLYVDGQQAGSPRASSPGGSSDDLTIGAAPDYLGSRNFTGNICQVAIYNYAFSASQVSTLYGNIDTAPTVSVTPANPSVYAGSSVTFTADVTGTPATSLQWYTIDTSNNSNNIAGANSATYTLDNVPLADNGYTFGVIAANQYGTNSASTLLSVQNGPAYLPAGGDISPLIAEAYVGAPVTYTVHAAGSLPIAYQWTINGTNVNGATNSSFTFPAPCGSNLVQVSFTNNQNGGAPVLSTTVTLLSDAVPDLLTFNTNGTGWQLNTAGVGGAPTIVSNVLELTDNGAGEASSAFYTTAQYVGSFNAAFTYTAGGNIGADGAVFILQNDPIGATALGQAGGDLGYFQITNSVGFEMDIYSGNGIGIALGTNGNTLGSGLGAPYASTGAVALNSGDPIDISLNYASGSLAVRMSDSIAGTSFSTNYAVGPLTPILGGSDLAFVGFSGGDGGATSVQTISNFSFTSTLAAVSLAIQPSGSSVVLTWPATSGNYELQQASSLAGPWTAGPSSTVVGGNNQATVPVGAGAKFFRLVRVVCQ